MRKKKTKKENQKENNSHTPPPTLQEPQSTLRSSKEQRLFDNILKTTLGFVTGKGFKTLTEIELIQRLQIPQQHRQLFTEILDSLVASHTLSLHLGRYSLASPESKENQSLTSDLIRGIINLHPRGFGFVKPDNPTIYLEDIFIPKHQTYNAVDGDAVEVLVNTEFVSEKGPEGKVVRVLSRARTHLAGIVTEIGYQGTPYAYAPMLGTDQKIIVQMEGRKKLKLGDRIVMEVIEWGNKNNSTTCKFTQSLGNISDPSCDVNAAIEEYDLRKTFSESVQQEALTFGKLVPLKEIRKREDLRKVTCFTIDPDTAKDYDDAISLTKDSDGRYHLGVHIADVSHYVTQDGIIDLEARQRSNSTYFPGFCLPMLPRELSDNLCSLKPNVNRLTVSVLMEFDNNGEMCHYRITRSVIKSCKRFTYREAKSVLDGVKKSPHAEKLHLMVELCGLLKKKRYERGSIEFGMPELVVIVDEQGAPVKTDYIVYDITHQLVEEFMLKANETVALHLSNENKPLTYRVHDEPAEENMKDFSLLASAFGYELSPTPTPKEIQKLFDEAMSTPYGEYLATSYIRRMRLAVYSADNIGHYGLSLTHYCHFTSPIRRYVDLVVHRILFHEEKTKEDLDKISEQCSKQERISAKAENSVVLLKKLRLLDSYNKEKPKREYEAIITRVKNFGIYFEVIEFMLEGFLHVSDLEDDYFIFDEETMALRGRHHRQSYTAGNKIIVSLMEVDLIKQESNWRFIERVDQDEAKQVKVTRVPRPGRRKKTPNRASRPGRSKKTRDVTGASRPGKSKGKRK